MSPTHREALSIDTRRLFDKDARHKRRNERGSGHSPINGVKGMPPANEQLNGQHAHKGEKQRR